MVVRPVQINKSTEKVSRETISKLMKEHRSKVLASAAKNDRDIGVQFNMGKYRGK